MRHFTALALFLGAATLSAVPCAPSTTRLCLNGARFAAEVSWRDFQGNTGAGHPVSLTGDTGYFWFFSSTNVELVVKVLDGRGINSSFWVFYGALSNVEYSMTVTDTVTGTIKTYANPSGHLGSVADTSAFPAAGAFPSPAAKQALHGNPTSEEFHGHAFAPAAAAACAPTTTSLCLNGGRFRAEVSWRDFTGNQGQGQAIALTADTGYFWFFNAANVELVVKVLDGRGLNRDFWVFYGALSTVQYELKVTDTLTGRTTYYFNPPNNLASVADTSAIGDGAFVQTAHDSSHGSQKRTGLFPQRPRLELAKARREALRRPARLGRLDPRPAARHEVLSRPERRPRQGRHALREGHGGRALPRPGPRRTRHLDRAGRGVEVGKR